MTPQAEKLVANSIPVEAVPVRGRFAPWRVRVKRPGGVDRERPFHGAHNRRCWKCNPCPLDALDPEQMSEFDYYYHLQYHFVYGICQRCGDTHGGGKAR